MKIQFEMRKQQTNWPRPLRDLQVGGGWNKWAANGMDPTEGTPKMKLSKHVTKTR